MDIVAAGISELKANARRQVIQLANQTYLIDEDISNLIKNEIDLIDVVEYLTLPQLSNIAPLIFNVYGDDKAEKSLILTATTEGINYMIIDRISQSLVEQVNNIPISTINKIIQDYMDKYVKL